jgi:predicted carbohydrate-binding protein with CBM5 and CBM33 domain
MRNTITSILSLLAVTLSALGHGSMADPVSRVYSIFLENPETPQTEAARAAMAKFRGEFEQLRVALLLDRMAKSTQVANLTERRRRLAAGHELTS